MQPAPRSTLLRSLLIGLALLLGPAVSWAQTAPVAPRGYDFLTVMTIEVNAKNAAKMLITPAFQGKEEVQLADFNSNYYTDKRREIIHRNTLLINQQLSELTLAGWELVQVYSIQDLVPTTRYLFRKPRP